MSKFYVGDRVSYRNSKTSSMDGVIKRVGTTPALGKYYIDFANKKTGWYSEDRLTLVEETGTININDYSDLGSRIGTDKHELARQLAEAAPEVAGEIRELFPDAFKLAYNPEYIYVIKSNNKIFKLSCDSISEYYFFDLCGSVKRYGAGSASGQEALDFNFDVIEFTNFPDFAKWLYEETIKPS